MIILPLQTHSMLNILDCPRGVLQGSIPGSQAPVGPLESQEEEPYLDGNECQGRTYLLPNRLLCSPLEGSPSVVWAVVGGIPQEADLEVTSSFCSSFLEFYSLPAGALSWRFLWSLSWVHRCVRCICGLCIGLEAGAVEGKGVGEQGLQGACWWALSLRSYFKYLPWKLHLALPST